MTKKNQTISIDERYLEIKEKYAEFFKQCDEYLSQHPTARIVYEGMPESEKPFISFRYIKNGIQHDDEIQLIFKDDDEG